MVTRLGGMWTRRCGAGLWGLGANPPPGPSLWEGGLAVEHGEHALGDQESAGDVDGGDEDGDGAEDGGDGGGAGGVGELEHAADEDDAADGVGDAHERGVECGLDVPDDLPADE